MGYRVETMDAIEETEEGGDYRESLENEKEE